MICVGQSVDKHVLVTFRQGSCQFTDFEGTKGLVGLCGKSESRVVNQNARDSRRLLRLRYHAHKLLRSA